MESVVTVRVPQESKELARANLGRHGLSLSDYLRAALEFMSSSRELPADFELLVSEERADARLMNLENLFDLVCSSIDGNMARLCWEIPCKKCPFNGSQSVVLCFVPEIC